MSSPIIAAIRQQRQLKESVLHTAQELAHRASIYGVVPPTSYGYLAEKAHCSPRTAIRHVRILEVEEKIIEPIRQKRIVQRKDLPPDDRRYSDDPRHAHERVMINEINRYRFRIKWDKSPQRSSSASRPYDRMARKLSPTKERGKEGSLREENRRQENWFLKSGLTPGSMLYAWTVEDIAQGKALVGERYGRD